MFSLTCKDEGGLRIVLLFALEEALPMDELSAITLLEDAEDCGNV